MSKLAFASQLLHQHPILPPAVATPAPRGTSAATESPVVTIRRAAATAPITLTKLRGGVTVLEGSGGNIGVLAGRDGKVLVDAGITASKPRILEALAALGAQPITHLINTHWHFDHTDGNEWVHAQGAVITAHENTLRRLSTETRVNGWDFTFAAAPAGTLPTNVLRGDSTLHLHGTALAVKRYPPAHTDSDLSVEFTEAGVLHVGDTWWNGHYPFIDYSTGGSIDGSIAAAEANVNRVSRNTLVIPGHGPVGGRAELIEFRDMLVEIRERVAALKKQGRSLAETVAAKPTAAYDAKWGSFVIGPAKFTGLVYQGV